MSIAKFIKTQYKDISELGDDVLLAQYCESRAMERRVERVRGILQKCGVEDKKCKRIMKKLVDILIPPGVKAKIKGDVFNNVIGDELEALIKGIRKKLQFKRESPHVMFSEIPDWVITHGNKTLVGYNQVSLFGGGHQLNRASKYVMEDTTHRKLARKGIRMVCVVSDVPRNTKAGSKTHKILTNGIRKKRIYCVRGLRKLLKEFFV